MSKLFSQIKDRNSQVFKKIYTDFKLHFHETFILNAQKYIMTVITFVVAK